MLPAWLRQFARKFAPTSPPAYRRPRYVRKFALEQFEDRVVPSTVKWVGTAGANWTASVTNWQGQTTFQNRFPGSTDDVLIPDSARSGRPTRPSPTAAAA